MSGNIIHDDSGKAENLATLNREKAILATLRRFERDGTGTNKERKYQCANRLINYSKSDLEIAKADIEFHIQNSGASTALLAAYGTILSIWMPLWIPIQLPVQIPTQIIITTIFTGLGAYYLLFGVGGRVSYLHILKIALARKSDT